ncbi:MAG TPA: hypothetical protein VMF89_09190 [Polyangiales bacterium]|nr:hypothetical protein [Polyangiales bacterium]
MLTLQRWTDSALVRFGRNLLLIGVVACGGDDSDDSSKEDAASTAKAGKGGSGGSGGRATAAAGRGGEIPRVTPAQNDSAYMCKPKPEDKGGIGEDGARCGAGMGRCASDVSEGIANGFPRDTCAEDLRCLPNMREVAAAADDGTDAGMPLAFPACRVMFPGAPAEFPDYEGRCLPTFFAKDNPLAARLQQSTCAAGELCAPCFDPLTGDSAGSCELQGDEPKEAAPTAFADCADGHGYCVPAFAAGMQAGQLAQLTCGEGELCGPKNKVADPNACFARCDAGSFGAGACVPAFLASIGAGILSRGECEEGMVCGPCELLGMRTGVCD